jgi:uncharacterized membrane protein
MYENRPKIKIPLENIDVILELVTLAILVILWGYVLMSYTTLPDIVPSHFNGNGEVNSTAGKGSVWALMAITTVITVGIHILTKYPNIHNYMVNITEENAAYYYKISCRLLRFVNLCTLLVMAYVAYSVITIAMGKKIMLESSFIYIIIGFAVVIPVVLFVYMSKSKKDELSKK